MHKSSELGDKKLGLRERSFPFLFKLAKTKKQTNKAVVGEPKGIPYSIQILNLELKILNTEAALNYSPDSSCY